MQTLFLVEVFMVMNLGMIYVCIVGFECWEDVGFLVLEVGDDMVHWDIGVIVGMGIGGMDIIGNMFIL